MPRLSLDIETRNVNTPDCDLKRVGAYRYFRHPTTQVTVACWAIGQEPVQRWCLGMKRPGALIDALRDPGVTVHAWNAPFEMEGVGCLLGPMWDIPPIPLDRWRCSMAQARACGLPGSLDQAGVALRMPLAKDREGHALMLRMCKPRRIFEVEDGATLLTEPRYSRWGGKVIEWWWDDDRVKRLVDYCARDVEVERAISFLLPPLPDEELEVWRMTQRMNDQGMRFDLGFVRDAIGVAATAQRQLDAEMGTVTRGAVPAATNVSALKRWLTQMGVRIAPPAGGEEEEDGEDAPVWDGRNEPEEEDEPELRRRDVERLLKDPEVTGSPRRALQIRLEAGKSSTKKLHAILARADADGYVRGLLTYHGTHTGRDSAAGGGVQSQNFPRDVLTDAMWDQAAACMKYGAAPIDALFGPPLDVIARMLRGSIIPDDGADIISCDYSSVEARGVCWVFGQDDAVEAFRSGAKMYEAMGARIFRVPVETITKESFWRWCGKQVTLGAGYQLGALGFQRYCEAMGVTVDLDLAERAIAAYREANPRVVSGWYGMNDAAMEAIQNPETTVTVEGTRGRIRFRKQGLWLRMMLPSGRQIRYANPRLEVDPRFDREGIVYDGLHPKTKKWGKQRTFGGRLTENAVQGFCRDLMIHGIRNVLTRPYYRPLTRTHDEGVFCARKGEGSTEEVVRLMCDLPRWAAGFPIAAEAWRGPRYA